MGSKVSVDDVICSFDQNIAPDCGLVPSGGKLVTGKVGSKPGIFESVGNVLSNFVQSLP